MGRRGLIFCSGAEKVGRSRCKLRSPGGLQAERGPDYVAHVFAFLGSTIIYRLQQLTFSDQAPVTLQLTVRLADLIKEFCRSALAVGPFKPDETFTVEPELAFGTPDC